MTFNGGAQSGFYTMYIENSCYMNTINEYTAGSGVTIDGLLIKDSRPVRNSTWLVSEALTADHTLSTTDSGRAIFVDTSAGAVTLTLPSTALGVAYEIIINGVGNALNISPAAADKIIGLNNAGTDNKDLILATPVIGDYIKIFGDGADGWYVQEASGTFTREA